MADQDLAFDFQDVAVLEMSLVLAEGLNAHQSSRAMCSIGTKDLLCKAFRRHTQQATLGLRHGLDTVMESTLTRI
jgi:hypothetical protein